MVVKVFFFFGFVFFNLASVVVMEMRVVML